MTSLEHLVSKYKTRDLTGGEVKSVCGLEPILYSDLKNYKSIDQLIGKQKSAIILYQTSNKTDGHYVCCGQRSSGQYFFFDSYGIHWGSEKMYGADFDKSLPRYLDNLFQKTVQQTGKEVEWNTYDFQSRNPTITTCGRWASLAALWKNLSNKEFVGLFTHNKDPFLQNHDNCSVILTMLQLKNVREAFDLTN